MTVSTEGCETRTLTISVKDLVEIKVIADRVEDLISRVSLGQNDSALKRMQRSEKEDVVTGIIRSGRESSPPLLILL